MQDESSRNGIREEKIALQREKERKERENVKISENDKRKDETGSI